MKSINHPPSGVPHHAGCVNNCLIQTFREKCNMLYIAEKLPTIFCISQHSSICIFYWLDLSRCYVGEGCTMNGTMNHVIPLHKSMFCRSWMSHCDTNDTSWVVRIVAQPIMGGRMISLPPALNPSLKTQLYGECVKLPSQDTMLAPARLICTLWLVTFTSGLMNNNAEYNDLDLHVPQR